VTVTDPQTKKKVPSILATPIAITKANVAKPINDQYTPKSTVCKGKYVSLCTKAGVQ
jgi:D-xylose transport system substrate-binding protein